MDRFDLVIIGAGIVGGAVLKQYQLKHPHHSVLLIDKEAKPAFHQTGRNSGVIHAGVYYPPRSLKAQFCQQGLRDTIAWCQQHRLPYEQCGKLIVATNKKELERLNQLYFNCQENGLEPQRISASKLVKMEPNITGLEAIFVAATGITDYSSITASFLHSAAKSNRVSVRYHCVLNGIDESDKVVRLAITSKGHKQTIKADRVICCAGVYADDLILKQGITPNFKIVPFKGEYYRLSEQFNGISERLIYPVPNPEMPFLGVHLTKMIGGYTTVGPNAVLAPGREAYHSLPSISEMLRTVSYRGLWRLLWQYKSSVFDEVKSSLSKRMYARLVQKYCPLISQDAFGYYRPGIRAQAVTPEGKLVSDFEFVTTDRVLHVANAPSPAATSAIPIANAILNKFDGM